MSTVLHWIDSLLKWAGMLLIALPLLWLAIAQIDVPLSPEAQAWQHPETDEVAAEQNAYYAMIGFYARDPAADINRVGQGMLGEYIERLKADRGMKDFSYRHELKIAGKPSTLCEPTKGSCLETAASHRNEVLRLTEDNALLLQRYASLYGYPHYRETAPPYLSSPLPSYPGAAHDLLLAKLALEAQRRPAPALEALARDSEFWRMVLRESRHVVGKLVAARYLLANLHLLSDIVASVPIQGADGAVVERMLRPLDRDDLSMEAAIRNEYRTVLTSVALAYDDGIRQDLQKRPAFVRAIMLPLTSAAFRPNDTANVLREYAGDAGGASRAGSNNHAAPASASKTRSFGDSAWDFLYNPAGKYFIFVNPVDLAKFSTRVRDLDGFVRLVTLQWTIRKNRIGSEGIPAFLAATPDTLRDPHTGRPMNWSADTGILWFPRKGARTGEKDRLEARL